jgi:SAM-dependent methyltransferase
MPVLERFSANHAMPIWLRHQHLARYHWAAELVRNGSVADAACGSGFGAKILGDAGNRVDGFDLAPEAIAEANELFASPALTFRVADALALPVAEHTYDAYTSFETIEHVERPREFLREVRRVLKPDGVFLCSTPNRELTNPGITITDRPFNRFHVREYTPAEFVDELRAFFPGVELWGQSPYPRPYAAALGRLARVRPMLAVRAHQARKVCGIPWEHRRRHRVARYCANSPAEVLVAVCRT